MEPGKPKILIVDDLTENVDLLMFILKSDYIVSGALNGEMALQIAQENKPDLILLDIVMPDMNGYEVCRQLKSNESTKDIPIIFITALSEALNEARAFSAGAVDYIAKPFTPLIVKARIQTHINLKIKTDMLEQLVELDGLTGIFNRRKFDVLLNNEWNRALRKQKPISLMLIDIDHFKLFNDNYGHANGDECLKKIAECMKNSFMRSSDAVCRYGGEEFAVILPETDLEGAENLAEIFRLGIEALNITHEYSETADHVTASIGVATVIPDPPNNSPSDFIEIVDTMLYESKRKGRNRVSVFKHINNRDIVQESSGPGFYQHPFPQQSSHRSVLS